MKQKTGGIVLFFSPSVFACGESTSLIRGRQAVAAGMGIDRPCGITADSLLLQTETPCRNWQGVSSQYLLGNKAYLLVDLAQGLFSNIGCLLGAVTVDAFQISLVLHQP